MNHKFWRAFRFYLISCLLAVIVMVPFLWMLSTSLKSKGALMEIPIRWIPENPTMDAYRKVFSKFPFLRAIFNSFFITTSYTLITILSASMAAFAFTKIRFPGADGLLKLYLASMMIPTQVTLIPLFVIMNKLGLINTYPSVILPSLFRVFGILCWCSKCDPYPMILWKRPGSTARGCSGSSGWSFFPCAALPSPH